MIERLREQLATFIRGVAGRLDHALPYAATVRAQAGDGTLELELDRGAPVPALVGVPVRHGLPGVTGVLVAAGARVRVGFDAGDPSKPFAALWDAGDATRVTFNSGTHPAARQGHAVSSSATMAAWMTAVTTKLNTGMGTAPTPPTTIGAIAEGSDVVRLP